MSLIARLGRIAAQRMYKHAVGPLQPSPGGQLSTLAGPTAQNDLANRSLGTPSPLTAESLRAGDHLSKELDPELAESGSAAGWKYRDPAGRARQTGRNATVSPGTGGSAWSSKIVGRGGAHPDSPWANKMLNTPYGGTQAGSPSPTGPVGEGSGTPPNPRTGHPGRQSGQELHSNRMLAQDPRGAGGWAEQTHQQAIDAMGGKPSPPRRPGKMLGPK
jgi:hypothetical protein